VDQASTEIALAEEGWRLSLASYAEVASRGRNGGDVRNQNRRAWYPYRWLQHVAKIVSLAVMRGGGRVIVNAPPQHGKSQLLSQWLPLWFLDLYPEKRVILTSYADTLAAHWGRKVRDELMANERCWAKLRPDMTSVSDWETTAGGGMLTAGVGGSITGRSGDLMIVDDPFKNWEEAQSPTIRRKVADWFDSTLYPRQQKDTTIVVVQTRWHEADLTGYLLEEHSEDGWTQVRLPALAGNKDPIGREPGEALCPERFPLEKLLATKRTLPDPKWESLYQQNPSPPGGTIIKEPWIQVIDDLPCEVEALTRWVGSWDLTFEATGTSRVAGGVWAWLPDKRRILLDAESEKYGFLDQIDAIGRQVAKWPQLRRPGSEILIEKAANGAAVIEVLQSKLNTVPIPVHDSKDVRLMAVSPEFREGGVVALKRDWTRTWSKELTQFPFAEDDDYVDMTTMALLRYKADSSRQGVINPRPPDVIKGRRRAQFNV
jgi:predicted phage terminase large subunit-like protein